MNLQSNFGSNYNEKSEVNMNTIDNTQVSRQKIGEVQENDNLNFQSMNTSEYVAPQNFTIAGKFILNVLKFMPEQFIHRKLQSSTLYIYIYC